MKIPPVIAVVAAHSIFPGATYVLECTGPGVCIVFQLFSFNEFIYLGQRHANCDIGYISGDIILPFMCLFERSGFFLPREAE